MKIRTVLAATAAVSLAASPAIAQADRAIAPVAGANALGNDDDGSNTGIILALLAVAAIVAGIVIASDNDDDTPDLPVSP